MPKKTIAQGIAFLFIVGLVMGMMMFNKWLIKEIEIIEEESIRSRPSTVAPKVIKSKPIEPRMADIDPDNDPLAPMKKKEPEVIDVLEKAPAKKAPKVYEIPADTDIMIQ